MWLTNGVGWPRFLAWWKAAWYENDINREGDKDAQSDIVRGGSYFSNERIASKEHLLVSMFCASYTGGKPLRASRRTEQSPRWGRGWWQGRKG
jgi:hypothetical protein